MQHSSFPFLKLKDLEISMMEVMFSDKSRTTQPATHRHNPENLNPSHKLPYFQINHWQYIMLLISITGILLFILQIYIKYR